MNWHLYQNIITQYNPTIAVRDAKTYSASEVYQAEGFILSRGG